MEERGSKGKAGSGGGWDGERKIHAGERLGPGRAELGRTKICTKEGQNDERTMD